MNIETVKQELREHYPKVAIKENVNEDGLVTEVVGEIDRKLVGSERDVAVVVADQSAEHWHNIITEEYKVIKGSLRVFRNGQPTNLQVGETIIIEPGTRHRVEGNETWFFCYSMPDWFSGDLHLVETDH